jgi:hypothetical protein
VNEAIRAEVERRRRNRLLTGMLDSLDAEHGPVDEALVAAAVETGGGVVLTGDPDDLASLAAPYPNITVQPLP